MTTLPCDWEGISNMNSIFSQQNIFKVCCIVIEWETAWIFFVNEIYSLALVNHDLWVYLVVEKNWAAGFKLIFVHETQDWDIVLATNTEDKYLYKLYFTQSKSIQFNWCVSDPFLQGWGAWAGCFWLLRAGARWEKKQEPEPLEKKIEEPEPKPLEKKRGAGAEKKLAGSSALLFFKRIRIVKKTKIHRKVYVCIKYLFD